jgi:hypothetical protein
MDIQRELFEDDLKSTVWIGDVVDNEDPTFNGRVRVKVKGKFDKFENEDIPWATPDTYFSAGSSSGAGNYDVPKVGTILGVIFDNDNIYSPRYFKIQHVSQELIDEVISVSDTPYTVKALWYDTDINLKTYFNEADGISISYKDSIINMRDDNTIWLQHNGGLGIHIQEDMISLGSETESAEPAVLGDKNVDALIELHDRIKDLTDAIKTFCTTQSSVTKAVYLLAPLTPGYDSLLAQVAGILGQLPNLLNTTIPATLSEKVSLD